MMPDQAPVEDGYTVIEMTVTTALMLVVLAMLLPLLAGSLNLFTNTQVRSDTVDNAQLALSQISHDVVSSNLLYIDSSGIAPVVHLETYGKGATSTCVEYQVLYPASPQAQIGTLQRRTKAPGSGASWPGSWTSIMTGIVNSSQPSPAPSVFSVPLATSLPVPGTGQSLVLNMWVQVDTRSSATAAAPEDYTSTFTGPAIPANVPPPATPIPSSEPC